MLHSKKDLEYEIKYIEKLINEIKNNIIKDRIYNVLIWYVRSAHYQRGRYLAAIIFAAILNAVIPVLVLCHPPDAIDIIVASFSALSGILMILCANYKWHDNWLKSRRNAEVIKSRIALYVNHFKPFDNKDADERFLQEIENNIIEDGNKWYESRLKQNNN